MALGSPNQLQKLAAVLDHIAYHLGETAFVRLNAAEQKLFRDFVEMTLNTISQAGSWKWLEREHVVNVLPPVEGPGTITLTQDSTAVLGAATTFQASGVRDRLDHLQAGEIAGALRIASVTDALNLTLSGNYPGVTVAGATYAIFQTEYELPEGVDFLLSVEEQNTPGHLEITGYRDLVRKRDSQRWITGRPRWVALIGEDHGAVNAALEPAPQTTRILFYPVPDQRYHVMVRYRSLATFPTEAFESGPGLQNILISGVMARVWMYRGKPEKAGPFGSAFKRDLTLAVGRQNKAQSTRVVMDPSWDPVGRLDGLHPFVPDQIIE